MGKGLFAHGRSIIERGGLEPVFRKGNLITTYDAERITLSELKARYGNQTAPYALAGHGNGVHDAACHRGMGSLANDPRGTGRRSNARLVVGRNGGSLRATRSVFSGDEILVSYGREYWRGHDTMTAAA